MGSTVVVDRIILLLVQDLGSQETCKGWGRAILDPTGHQVLR